MIARLFKRDPYARPAATLYLAVVEQARQPGLYGRGGVPDTVQGRYELLMMHAGLVIDRLAGGGEAAGRFAQALFDHMFADMDRSLRELGVGDLGVGRRVRKMAEGFYGRAAAYRTALEQPAGARAAIRAALLRNLYGGVPPRGDALEAMADHVGRVHAALGAAGIADLMAGRLPLVAMPEADPVQEERRHGAS